MDDRVGRTATLIASQLPIDHWHGLVENPTVADAILDRLLHHSHVLNIRGESYRLREKKQAGFFGTPPASREAH